MTNYIKIEIDTTSSEQMEILIAELSEIHFEAFEENENSISAFIKEDLFNDEALKNILSPNNISYTKSIIEETNWNAKWESEFEPIIVDNFVAIRAAFHTPIESVKHEVIITPKMSFGTGHHATTYLMLQQMENIDFTDKKVLDFGTGTGILAILAKKLGAKKVLAIDYDEWSINNAKENFIANNCTDIDLLQKNDLNGLEAFDIILANINLNVITANNNHLALISQPSSTLLLSGFLSHDEENILQTFASLNFKHIITTERNGWISMLLTKS